MSIGIAKAAIDLVVSLGVGTVVSNAVKATTPDGLKIVGKIMVTVGSVVVTSAVSDLASKHVVGQVEKAWDDFKAKKVSEPDTEEEE